MNLPPEVVADILAEYKRTRSPFKAANAVGVPVETVWMVIDQNKDKLSSFEERHGGYGRPEMRQYLVARRRASEREWPDVTDARKAYEDGTHEMATGRDGAWLLLYLIPRRWPATGREKYFTVDVG